MKRKKLERNKETAMVAGVLSGLAQYFNQDPVWFRLLAIVFIILTGVFPGLLFYLVAWIIMPNKPKIHADYEL